MSLRHGTCKKWIVERGFGFLADDADGRSIFVHQSALEDTTLINGLEIGQRVVYDTGEDKSGRECAIRVALA
jgi:cold shock CspA family protein